MEDTSNKTCYCQSLVANAQNGSTRKRQRTAIVDTIGQSPSPVQTGGVLAAMNKLTKLVEHHPKLHPKLEKILEDIYNELEPEVTATTRKQKNETSCPIYKLSNDALNLIFGNVNKKQYRFVACTSYRFQQVYLDSFGGI